MSEDLGTEKAISQHVFISHVSDDPDWPPDQIEAIVDAMRSSGIAVRMGLWGQSEGVRFQSVGAWYSWVNEVVIGAESILCLVSPYYERLWKKPFDSTADGLALQAISVIVDSNQDQQRSRDRLITVRQKGRDSSSVPEDLAYLPSVEWPVDRIKLLSWLSAKDARLRLKELQHSIEERMSLMARTQSQISEVLYRIERTSQQVRGAGFWPAEDTWRAPVGDFPPLWASAWGDDVYGLWADLTVNGVTQRMRWVEPSGPEGFWMGSSEAERDAIVLDRVRQWARNTEQSVRKEYVESGFWFADTPCTQALWVAVVGENPSLFGGSENSVGRPVECVTWDDVVYKFIANISLVFNRVEDFFAYLPTEKEWEYAARAGSRTSYWWGDEDDSRYANWDSKHQSTTPVGSYQPNPWGLFDMHGNVWEWCADAWQPVRGSLDPPPDETCRVSRGGSWINPPSRGRAAHRGMWPRALMHQNQGFRFAIASRGNAKETINHRREEMSRDVFRIISEDRGNLVDADLVGHDPQADMLSNSGRYSQHYLMDSSRWASGFGSDEYGFWADLTVNGVTQRMRWIEPSGPDGFWMGSTKKERAAIKNKDARDWANQVEHEPRRVVIAEGFWLADTLCTQAFWQAVTGKNPSHFDMGRDAPERPVENVSWNDVMAQFIGRFAETPEWGTADRLCLPNEAQWEYAARAGTRSAYWWGDVWDEIRGNANLTGKRHWDDKEGTTPVRRYAPNPWGLFDMHGNIWEWCSDLWRPRRDALWRPRQDAPEVRPDEDGRVVRGGSWISHPGFARAAYRDWRHRGLAPKSQGFRFVLRSSAVPEAR